MHVLVATTQFQGVRDDDFYACVEGELVFFGRTCRSCSIDDTCGCFRAMAGMSTHGATSTFMVVDNPDMTPATLCWLYKHSLVHPGQRQTSVRTTEVMRYVNEMINCAQRFAPGLILERNGAEVSVRGCTCVANGAEPYRPHDGHLPSP